ncbi:MAG TPA: hypothetical protein VG939_22750 [Caulobacteraceae bacterium]|nr:hypothetical protein [Caulobacteraceae bacterium]
MRQSIAWALAGAACLGIWAAPAGAGPVARHAARAALRANVLHISSHLAEPAQVSVDGAKAVTAPGYGSTTVSVAAGHHELRVISGEGVSYVASVDLAAGDLMTWKGKSYWCVNLLETSVERYSKEECQEDVTDAG